MATSSVTLPVALPELRALRFASDELHAGMKETYAIARLERGAKSWWAGGRAWDVSPGTIQLQQPGDVHRDVARDGLGVAQIVSLPAHVVEAAGATRRVDAVLPVGDPRGAPFHRLHDAIAAGADRFALEVALAEVVAALVAFGDDRCEHTRPVRRAIEMLRARLAEPVSLDEIAAHAGLDKFHLCRAFRAQVGLPPHAYLTRLRIMRAKQLLAAGMKASEVALEVGLYDQSLLNRHFRRLVGTTPARYARGG